MASRIRTVKPEIFRHEELYALEQKTAPQLRLFWIGLFTLTDRHGWFEWKPNIIKLDILPYDDVDVNILLMALWGSSFIQKYAIDGRHYGFIPSWPRHQYINHREKSKMPETPDQDCLLEFDAPTPPGKPRERLGQDRVEGKGKEGKGREVSSPTCTVITVRRTSSNEVAEIIGYLNKVAHKKFSPESLDTEKLITFKIKSGYTVTDFKHVINVKTEQWLNDPIQDMYLRPKTLFGSKFEGYLNEKPRELLLSNTKPPMTFADLLAEEDACHE